MATQYSDIIPSVLIVEDEFIIAMDITDTVSDLGLRVAGPFVSKQKALTAIDGIMPDVAILDVFTADGEVYPLADILNAAGVPIIFHSGHACETEIRQRYPTAQAVSKPCPPAKLIALLESALLQRAARSN